MIRRTLVYGLILFVLVMTAASLASAADLCVNLDTSGTVYIFKGVKMRRGTTFPLNGYSNHFIAFPEISQSPVVGQAMLSSDGKHMILGLTEYNVSLIHDIGSHQTNGDGQGTVSDQETMLFQSVNPLGVGSTGGFLDSKGNIETAEIINCGPQDDGLTPP